MNSNKTSNDEQEFLSFLTDAIDTGCVWGLFGEEGWAQCGSEKHKDSTVIPFWSQPELADQHKSGEWQQYETTAIALEEFLDDWLVGMHADELLVGIDWNEELEGAEYEPIDLLEEFERVLAEK